MYPPVKTTRSGSSSRKAVEEGGGVEVGAPGHLGREHVLAARGRGQRVQYSAPFAVHMS